MCIACVSFHPTWVWLLFTFEKQYLFKLTDRYIYFSFLCALEDDNEKEFDPFDIIERFLYLSVTFQAPSEFLLDIESLEYFSQDS